MKELNCNNIEEKQQYIEWIQELLPQKEKQLSLIQLKLIHFILGYNVSIMSEDDITEYADGLDMDECHAKDLWHALSVQGILLLEEPYPIQ